MNRRLSSRQLERLTGGKAMIALVESCSCGVIRSENEWSCFRREVMFLTLSFYSKPRHRTVRPWAFAQPFQLRLVIRKLKIERCAIKLLSHESNYTVSRHQQTSSFPGKHLQPRSEARFRSVTNWNRSCAANYVTVGSRCSFTNSFPFAVLEEDVKEEQEEGNQQYYQKHQQRDDAYDCFEVVLHLIRTKKVFLLSQPHRQGSRQYSSLPSDRTTRRFHPQLFCQSSLDKESQSDRHL